VIRDTLSVDADGSIAHVLVVGDVAKALKVSPEVMDTIGGRRPG
jgi:hypothetical protein